VGQFSLALKIQREMPGKSLLEVGYVGRHESNFYNPLEINVVPWMMTLSGQIYAQAYNAIAGELAAGAAATPQPFFESALKGSSLCAAPNARLLAFGNELFYCLPIASQSSSPFCVDLISTFVPSGAASRNSAKISLPPE